MDCVLKHITQLGSDGLDDAGWDLYDVIFWSISRMKNIIFYKSIIYILTWLTYLTLIKVKTKNNKICAILIIIISV